MASLSIKVFGRINKGRIERLLKLGEDTDSLSRRYAIDLGRRLRLILPVSKRRSVTTPRVRDQIYIRNTGGGIYKVGLKGNVAKYIIRGTDTHTITATKSKFRVQGVPASMRQQERVLQRRVREALIASDRIQKRGASRRQSTRGIFNRYERAEDALAAHQARMTTAAGRRGGPMLIFPWKGRYFVGPFVNHPGIVNPIPYVDIARNSIANQFGRDLRKLLEGRSA